MGAVGKEVEVVIKGSCEGFLSDGLGIFFILAVAVSISWL